MNTEKRATNEWVSENERRKLRDVFAGLAMAGQIAGDKAWNLSNERHMTKIVSDAYRMADAMLEARDKP